jgi:ribonucleoside-diphosphate reductase alpha chain
MTETSTPAAADAATSSNGTARRRRRGGLSFARHFSHEGVHPFDEIAWEIRDAVIRDQKGAVAFEQPGIEVPLEWTELASNIASSKYFRGLLGSPERETSVRQMIGRVVTAITEAGRKGGYFASYADAQIFSDELTWLLLHQRMAFNSPVWFNIGVAGVPQQASACFIQSVEDSMESILTLAKNEGMLFKGGSGTGSNLSALRSCKEHLSGGGWASGPVSFMRGFDAFAGAIKSGGTTRRAAKMVILNVDHPDIQEFIACKVVEERKAWALIDAGYDGAYTGEAYASISFQNANNSVRVTDEFMQAVEADTDWALTARLDGSVMERVRARDLLRLMAESAWQCGDPGIQFDTTVNLWHTCPNTARINATNPCAEFNFIDDTSCNLASINLLRYLSEDGSSFDVEGYRYTVDVSITAMEILVGYADYPTAQITEKSHQLRPLGLGYANLGALLMARGVAYDSDEGRHLAALLTSIMTGEAYAQSARIAAQIGAFEEFARNRNPMLAVIRRHRQAALDLPVEAEEQEMWEVSRQVWDEALQLGQAHGYRNAQSTVLAPTGTIAFLMSCDTTGIEPDIALVKYKKLVGGGMLKLVNQTVPVALRRLGYGGSQVEAIVGHIDAHDTIEGAPGLRDDHLGVFDCAFKPANGTRSIAWQGHVRMMAAVQPFLSGAVSKTCNLPEAATVEDVEAAYLDAWRRGLKALAVYRDNSKRSQPLALSSGEEKAKVAAAEPPVPVRRRLPSERSSVTHHFSVQGHEGYLIIGLFEDGSPGELFIKMAKEGSTVSGLTDSLAIAVSFSLQYGVPLAAMIGKFAHMRFDPQGFTGNPEVPIAKSIVDYVFRYLGSRFLSPEERHGLGIQPRPADLVLPYVFGGVHESSQETLTVTPAAGSNGHAPVAADPEHIVVVESVNRGDAPSCPECGNWMRRAGACYVCDSCGANTGCS